LAKQSVAAIVAAFEERAARLWVRCPECETEYRMVLPVNTLALVCVHCGDLIELRSN
jgi:ribosomal protein S27E